MPKFTHLTERGPIGIKKKGDPEPGVLVGPMRLPATYKKGPYVPPWAIARRKAGQGYKGRPKWLSLISFVFLFFVGCGPVQDESDPGVAMIKDSCLRCPYCCSRDDDLPLTDQDLINFCISENQDRLSEGWNPQKIEDYCSIGQ